MDCDHCGKCCFETSMQLSPLDIKRLVKLGFDGKDFTTRYGGFHVLKNVHGACFFLDPASNNCRVYAKRPEGCKYYPIIYSLDKRKPIVDKEVCHKASTVTKDELKRTTPGLTRLIKTIIKVSRTRNNKER